MKLVLDQSKMDGRRITATPRPCSGRRVLAKKRPRGGRDGFVNSVKKLQRREISSKRDRAFSMSDAQERFRNISLQVHLLNLLFSFRSASEMFEFLRVACISDDIFGLNSKIRTFEA